MADIYSEILKSLKKKEKVALATIISRTGSAPRAVGAQYLVREDGSSAGSIGGGCVEAEVWQKAQEVLEKERGCILQFSLTAEQLAEGGLICGGDIDILVEPLREDSIEIYEAIRRIKQKGGGALLITLVSLEGNFPKGGGSKTLLISSGERIGSFFGTEEMEERIRKERDVFLRGKKPKVFVLRREGGDSRSPEAEVLVEPIESEPTVYLFGAGHVSEQIAPLAKRVQFRVVVIDDRETFANRERFPEADEVLVSDFESCFERLHIDDASYIVIVTRGHLYDGFVLEQAVKTAARYVGMIGSKKKIHVLYQNLMKKGVPKEALDRVYAPIGVEINSETPEEIAVSIVAQLIQVRGES